MSCRPHGRHLRIGRVSESGRGYLLTTVVRDRRPIFEDFLLARIAIQELRVCDDAGLCNTLSFVLMPDHLHWLVQLQDAGLGALMRRFKSRSAIRLNNARGAVGAPVWQ